MYGTIVYPFIDDDAKNRYVQKWSEKNCWDICGGDRKNRQSGIVVIPCAHRRQPCLLARYFPDLFRRIGTLHRQGRHGTLAPWSAGFRARPARSFWNAAVHAISKAHWRHWSRTFRHVKRCIFFPEGTTGRQGKMLPFSPQPVRRRHQCRACPSSRSHCATSTATANTNRPSIPAATSVWRKA